MTRAQVAIRGVSQRFDADGASVTALDGIDFEVPDSQFVSVVGPSGCGKSTLLNMIAGLTPVDQGKVYRDGQLVSQPAVGVGYLTQHETLLPWRSIRDNVRLPFLINRRRGDRIPPQDADARVAWALDLVGLSDFAGHMPSELSGGMKKRAALAQTLVFARSTILMDEPFGALDSQTRLALQGELLTIWSTERRTILFVTHDIEEAITLSDRVLVLGRRGGELLDDIEIDLPRPRDPASIRFTSGFANFYQRLWRQVTDSPALAAP